MADKKYDFSAFDKQPKGYDFSAFDNKEQSDPDDTGLLATLVGKGLKGVTSGLSDRLEGAAGAALRAAGVTNAGGKLSNIGYDSPTLDIDKLTKAYYDSRNQARDRDERQQQANPVLSTAVELAGGFLTPGLGVVGSAGKGILNAVKTGVTIGALGGAAQAVSSTKEIEDLKAMDLAKSTALGAGLGGTLGAAGGLGGIKAATGIGGTLGAAYGASQGEDLADSAQKALGYGLAGAGAGAALGAGYKATKWAGSAVKDSKIGQDLLKIYNKTKAGVKLSGKEQETAFNNGLLDESGQIVDDVLEQAKKFDSEYAQKAKNLKIDPKAQQEIDGLMNKLAEEQAKGGKADPRPLNNKINELRKSKQLNEEEIAQIYSELDQKSASGKLMSDESKFSNIDDTKSQAEKIKEVNDFITEMRSSKRDVQKELKELKREPKESRDLLQQRVLEDKIQSIDDNIFSTRNDLANQRFGIKSGNLDRTAEQKASKDIASNSSDLSARIKELQGNNSDISRDISNTVLEKQGSVNDAADRMLTELEALKQSIPDTNYQTYKDVNRGSIDSAGKQLGREDLIGKVTDIIKSNTPGAQEADNLIKQKYTELANLGLKSTDNSAQNIKKTSDVVNNLTQTFKNAAKNDTGDAANKLASMQEAFSNPAIQNRMSRASELADNYNLNKKISESSLKSVTYRGAEGAGELYNTVQVGVSKINRAIDRLPGGSAIKAKLQEILTMPQDQQTRAIFTLSQQPWYRKLSEDNKEK